MRNDDDDDDDNDDDDDDSDSSGPRSSSFGMEVEAETASASGRRVRLDFDHDFDFDCDRDRDRGCTAGNVPRSLRCRSAPDDCAGWCDARPPDETDGIVVGWKASTPPRWVSATAAVRIVADRTMTLLCFLTLDL